MNNRREDTNLPAQASCLPKTETASPLPAPTTASACFGCLLGFPQDPKAKFNQRCDKIEKERRAEKTK